MVDIWSEFYEKETYFFNSTTTESFKPIGSNFFKNLSWKLKYWPSNIEYTGYKYQKLVFLCEAWTASSLSRVPRLLISKWETLRVPRIGHFLCGMWRDTSVCLRPKCESIYLQKRLCYRLFTYNSVTLYRKQCTTYVVVMTTQTVDFVNARFY